MKPSQAVRIVYGPTGGRYPMMFGIAEALEKKLLDLGIPIFDRVGISGGAIVAAARASGEEPQSFLLRCAHATSNMSMWGLNTPRSVWNIVRHGGFLNSAKVIENVFERVIQKTPDEPCYAISWCSSAEKPVCFPLQNSPHTAKYLCASAAVPIAFSPVKIDNRDLPDQVRDQIGVGIDGFSTFQDGGLCEVFPSDLIGGPVVPTIMVFIDPIPFSEQELLNQKPDLWVRFFGLKNKANSLAFSARRKPSVQLFVVPQLECFEKNRLSFDGDLSSSLSMYNHGKVMTEHSFRLFLSFPEKLDTQDQQREDDADDGLGLEHTLSEIVPSENGENEIGQAVGE